MRGFFSKRPLLFHSLKTLMDPSVPTPHNSTAATAVDPVLLQKWTSLQNDMRKEIVTHDTEEWQRDNLTTLQLIAGLDISYPKDAHDKSQTQAFAAIVVCRFPSMEVVYQKVECCQCDTPYVPGFLAFKELPHYLKLITALDKQFKPDVLLVDGNGLLHPQKCGVACHVGYHTNIPTIGVAKNLFVMEGVDCTKAQVQNMGAVGDSYIIKNKEEEPIGMALKTTLPSKNPIYVSIGHKISLDTARKTVLACCKHRVPEPLRFADAFSRERVRQLLQTN